MTLFAEDVKARVEQGNVTLVDSRLLVEFNRGHIKGTVSVPTNEIFMKSARSDLVATIIEMRDLVGAVGITSPSNVIVYGDKDFLDISR
ncbi:MAG TPA: hypothetical protein EYG29_07455 [Methylococcales bacterium]|nr:hypothetical protein [Methylococcales bacterium]